jgi:hypothetical protein
MLLCGKRKDTKYKIVHNDDNNNIAYNKQLRRADHPPKESYRLSLIKKLRKLSPMLQKWEQRGRKKIYSK